MTSSIPSSASTASATIATTETDALGSFGLALTKYHVGDLLQIASVVIGIVTIVIAQSARRAAKAAATAALARRDSLEVTSLLSEMMAKVNQVRSLLGSDDWGDLSEAINHAVSVVNRIVPAATQEEVDLLNQARKSLRDLQLKSSGIKDSTKHHSLRAKQDSILIKVVDDVEVAQNRRVKK